MIYAAIFLLFFAYLIIESRGEKLRGACFTLSIISVMGLLLCALEFSSIREVNLTQTEGYGIRTNTNLFMGNPPSSNVKIEVYVDNAAPPIGSTINLLVYAPEGSKVTAIARFKEGDQPRMFRIGKGGQAVVPLRVATSARGYTVVVDVIVEYNGKTFRKNTVFTPK